MLLQMFPLLAISLIIYAVLTFVGVGAGTCIDVGNDLQECGWHQIGLVNLPMYSKDYWAISWGDAFLVGSMVLLFVELIRATKTDSASITNHMLSFMLFVVTLLLFVLAPGFGNSTFFLFMAMTFLDPMAGFIVTTVTARRDFSVADGGIGKGLLG